MKLIEFVVGAEVLAADGLPCVQASFRRFDAWVRFLHGTSIGTGLLKLESRRSDMGWVKWSDINSTSSEISVRMLRIPGLYLKHTIFSCPRYFNRRCHCENFKSITKNVIPSSRNLLFRCYDDCKKPLIFKAVTY
jgi:hypothetical protein